MECTIEALRQCHPVEVIFAFYLIWVPPAVLVFWGLHAIADSIVQARFWKRIADRMAK